MTRAAIYARVSSVGRAGDGPSLQISSEKRRQSSTTPAEVTKISVLSRVSMRTEKS